MYKQIRNIVLYGISALSAVGSGCSKLKTYTYKVDWDSNGTIDIRWTESTIPNFATTNLFVDLDHDGVPDKKIICKDGKTLEGKITEKDKRELLLYKNMGPGFI